MGVQKKDVNSLEKKDLKESGIAYKYFVLDTNVLLYSPESLHAFGENVVVIPLTVVEELDKFKSLSDKKGKHARSVLRTIDKVIHKGALLNKGAKLKNGGRLLIAMAMAEIPIDSGINDNKILAIALHIQKEGHEVFFISKDLNARIKSEVLGIRANDFDKEMVEYQLLYKGWRELSVKNDLFEQFAQKHEMPVIQGLIPHECVMIKNEDDPKNSLIGRYDPVMQAVTQITHKQEAMGIHPVNLEQRFSYELLMDQRVSLVTLIGPAGTGKTLLALACGIEQVIGKHSHYEKILVARPIIPMGKDIGYLPGTKDQKLNYWMQPIFDNITFLLNNNDQTEAKDKFVKRDNKMDYLLDTGLLEVEALTYIRGRSIPNQFIVIDEAQNLTPHEVKTIISRAGKGSKIVLAGDPEQIDNPYLDANSNGLTYTAEKLKDQRIVGHMYLSKSERSELASIAASVL